MRIERRDRKARACTRVQAKAIRAAALEQVLAVLDKVPDTLTIRELRPAIEDTADRETIGLLRRQSPALLRGAVALPRSLVAACVLSQGTERRWSCDY